MFHVKQWGLEAVLGGVLVENSGIDKVVSGCKCGAEEWRNGTGTGHQLMVIGGGRDGHPAASPARFT
jgi:hypothetical protein